MTRIYTKLAQIATEVAYDMAINANFCADVDEDTRRYMDEYIEAIEHARTVIYKALTSQMSHDPQTPDIDITKNKS